MNPYIAIALLIAGFGGGWVTHGWKDTASEEKHAIAQQQATITAENAVITKQQKSQSINDQIVGDYEKDVSRIDDLYATSVQQPDSTASNGMPTVPKATRSTRPVSCARTSKVYKLTFDKCDKVQTGFNALWHDWELQAK